MLLNQTLHGSCVAPFYDASYFPNDGGYTGGRLCAKQEQLPESPLCCLPCPATYWTYSDNFVDLNTVAGWLNVVGLVLQVFMLVSYTVLPAAKTRSHYLTVCLIVSVMFINLAFVVPLGAQPDQCYNAITPNDMYSSLTCAWSGAFLLAGALAGTLWILIRALSMHLQICWDIIPGEKFFYVAQAAGWGVPAALFAAAISVTGVSFRFGNACHINHDDSMVTFWGWLLSVAGAAVIVQFCTFSYCLHVYCSSLWQHEEQTKDSTDSLPTSSTIARPPKARAIYRRLKSVLYLQWRSILIVMVVLTDVIFFAVIFVYLDRMEATVINDYTKIIPWLACLVESGGDKNTCYSLTENWLISEPTVGAMLIMVSLLGIELFILLFRKSLFLGWKELWSHKRSNEFVSLDARTMNRRPTKSSSPPYFEMQKPGTTRSNFDFDAKSIDSAGTDMGSRPNSFPDTTPRGPAPAYSPRHSPRRPEDDDAGVPVTMLRSVIPSLPSESSPSSSMSSRTRDAMGWDPASTFARGGVSHVAVLSRGSEDDDVRSLPGQAL